MTIPLNALEKFQPPQLHNYALALLSGSETFVHYTVQIYYPVGEKLCSFKNQKIPNLTWHYRVWCMTSGIASLYLRYLHSFIISIVNDSPLVASFLFLLELKVFEEDWRKAMALEESRTGSCFLLVLWKIFKAVQKGHIVVLFRCVLQAGTIDLF